jgi:hypothetical protein
VTQKRRAVKICDPSGRGLVNLLLHHFLPLYVHLTTVSTRIVAMDHNFHLLDEVKSVPQQISAENPCRIVFVCLGNICRSVSDHMCTHTHTHLTRVYTCKHMQVRE